MKKGLCNKISFRYGGLDCFLFGSCRANDVEGVLDKYRLISRAKINF